MVLYGKRNHKKRKEKRKHKKVQQLYTHKSEISARSHREEEMEGGPEQESESSPISVFSPPSLQILHTLIKLIGLLCQSFWVFLERKTFLFLWAGGAYLYQALGDACDQFLGGRKALDLSDAISMTWCIMFYV